MRAFIVSLFLALAIATSASAVLSGPKNPKEFMPPTGESQTAEQLAAAQAAQAAAERALAKAEADLQVANTEKARLEQELQVVRSARTKEIKRGDNAGAGKHQKVAAATSAQLAQVVARISTLEASVDSLRADHHKLRAQFENYADQPLGGWSNQQKFFDWFGRYYGIWPGQQQVVQPQPPASAGAPQLPSGATEETPKEVNSMLTTIALSALAVAVIVGVIMYIIYGAGGAGNAGPGVIGATRAAHGLGGWPWQRDTRGTLRIVRWGRNFYTEETRQRRYQQTPRP